MKLRIVFQGGGARLPTLIAAADVLSELIEEKDIEIDRVVGVSAGAIAAAMFGCRRDFTEQRRALRAAGASIIQHFKTPRGVVLGWKIMFGDALFDQAHLGTLLSDVLREQDKPLTRVSDLKYPTSIVCSDLRFRQLVVHDENSNQQLSRLLVDSCSFPFAFRTFKDRDLIVDGGLCANLPSDLVLDNKEVLDRGSDARVLAFAFERDLAAGAEPKSAVDYTRALFSTAIEASVEAAADRVRQSGGEVCRLPNQFNTFQFKDALNTGLDGDTYEVAKKQARTTIRQALNRFQKELAAGRSPRRGPSTVERVFAAHTALMKAFPCSVATNATIVHAYSLLPPSNPESALSDRIYQVVRFKAEKDSIIAARIGIASGMDPVQDIEESIVRDRFGALIPCNQATVTVPRPGNSKRLVSYSLIFFDEPIRAERCPIKVIHQTRQRGTMAGLPTQGWEWMRSYVSAGSGGPSTEDQLLIAPEGSPKLELQDLASNLDIIPKEQWPGDVGEMRQNWVVGARMDTETANAALYDYLGDGQGTNFTLYGWRTEQVERGHFTGVLLKRQ